MKALFNQVALWVFRLMPTRIVQHLLFLLRSHSEIPDRWEYHIRPIHYYEPLPDFRAISNEQLEHRRNYPAIDFNWSTQLELLSELGASYHREVAKLAQSKEPQGFDFQNDYFSGFDAAVYYGLIRYLKPQRVIEIGSGYSTRIADKALRRNQLEGQPGRLTCIEPYPEPRLTEANLEIELVIKPVESVDPSFFSCLSANDILFIDSTHTVKFGSDVCREFLEILPTLKPSVWIHVHDIFFPHDYPAEWLIQRRYAFNEQYLLEAFLSFNRDFHVALSNHWLCVDEPSVTERLWIPAPNVVHSSVGSPSSFWFCRGESKRLLTDFSPSYS